MRMICWVWVGQNVDIRFFLLITESFSSSYIWPVYNFLAQLDMSLDIFLNEFYDHESKTSSGLFLLRNRVSCLPSLSGSRGRGRWCQRNERRAVWTLVPPTSSDSRCPHWHSGGAVRLVRSAKRVRLSLGFVRCVA